MRISYDNQLKELNQELTRMGGLCEQIIGFAAQALTQWNEDLAEKVKKTGAEIDEMERSIEAVCMRLLLRQQPVAGDLRLVSAALKMITDMERIGDQAEDIVEIVPNMGETGKNAHPKIQEMAKHAISMVVDSVDAYTRQDMELAKAVLEHDDVVDSDFVQIKKELIGDIASNPAQGEDTLDLLMIAKYFERIADHATNVAEWVMYGMTGTHEVE